MSASLYPDIPENLAGAVLTVDLGAVVENYRILRDRLTSAECGAVVKANAYGLGADRVGPVLERAGCRKFFVAHVDEAIRLRRVLADADIHVLNGFIDGSAQAYRDNRLIPVLGSLREIGLWKVAQGNATLPCALHVDTGMLRLGLPPSELAAIADDGGLLDGLDIRFVMSHLASADEKSSPQSARQLDAFRSARRILPHGPASFSNSSGIFLGPDYHFDLARPGVALFGVNPTPGADNPMKPVVSLKARIVQVRDADAPETVGYGASHHIEKPTRVATVGVGYADGIPRSLSNRSLGYMDDIPTPLIGRVSMDLITFDVSEVPESRARPGDWIEMIGPRHGIDDMARDADTIGYELLTSLGRRYHRVYKEVG